MANKSEKIGLYAEAHAIEVANFVVNLGLPLDHADIRRFDEKSEKLKISFPAISSPSVFQIALGNAPNLPPPVPVKELTFFGNDGRPEWKGAFGENRILVSCRKYSRWEEVWPAAKARLDALLSCVDHYKPVHSVDYSVTDTFSAAKAEEALIPPNMFRNNDFIPNRILNTTDPRWDFSQGWFEDPTAHNEVLVRIEGRSGIQNDQVVASIGNLYSQRFGGGIGVGELLARKEAEEPIGDQVFADFHDKNKALLRLLLIDDLLARMRLKEE